MGEALLHEGILITKFINKERRDLSRDFDRYTRALRHWLVVHITVLVGQSIYQCLMLKTTCRPLHTT